jgi:hypothetical protein
MPAPPITIAVPPQWKVHRIDMKPRREDTA